MSGTDRRKSIQEIMNQMAGRMDSLLDARDDAHAAHQPAMLDEVLLWMAVDPLLADLHKQYLDAKANHACLRDKNGSKDAMAAIAADMEDSARCAVDTRILELRQSGEAKAVLQAMIRRAHDERYDAMVAAERARTAAYWKNFALRKAPRAVERGRNSFFSMMIGLMLLQQLVEHARLHLRIAEIFSTVAEPRARLAAS